MTIQEFSRQLGREGQSSQLIQALRTMRGLDRDQLPSAGEWIPWDDEPRAYPAQSER